MLQCFVYCLQVSSHLPLLDYQQSKLTLSRVVHLCSAPDLSDSWHGPEGLSFGNPHCEWSEPSGYHLCNLRSRQVSTSLTSLLSDLYC